MRFTAIACVLALTVSAVAGLGSGTAVAALDRVPEGPTGLPAEFQLDERGFAPRMRDAPLIIEIVSQSIVRLGDKVQFRIRSDRPGYLLVFDIKADRTVDLIFPNRFSRQSRHDHRVSRGEAVLIPDESYGFDFHASEPVGRGLLFGMVTREDVSQQHTIRALGRTADAAPLATTRGFGVQQRQSGSAPPVPDADPLRLLAVELIRAVERDLGPIGRNWTGTVVDYEIR